jgi:hypothetical protein
MEFPVISIHSSGSVMVNPSMENLCLCTAKALRENYYAGLRVVDSSGDAFKVVGIAGKKMLWYLPSLLFLNPMYRIELLFDSIEGKMTLQDVQMILGGRRKKCVKKAETLKDFMLCFL